MSHGTTNHPPAGDRAAERWMRRAIELAVANVESGRGGPFGAVVVRGGEVIGEGANAVTADGDPTAHAEIQAIRAACRRLGTFDLAGGEIYASCEPCPMCLGAIYWARLDRIWFAAGRDHAAAAGFSDDEIYRQIPRPPADRSIPARRLLAGEAEAPFALWAAQPDKIPY